MAQSREKETMKNVRFFVRILEAVPVQSLLVCASPLQMSRLMLSGWTLTARTCPVAGCNVSSSQSAVYFSLAWNFDPLILQHPLLKNADTLYCASCDAPIRIVSAEEAARLLENRTTADAGGVTATRSSPPRQPERPPVDRSALASKLLGQKLLAGWCMRAEACPACGTPFVTAKGAPDAFVCVLCSTAGPAEGNGLASAASVPAASGALRAGPPPTAPPASSVLSQGSLLDHLRGYIGDDDEEAEEGGAGAGDDADRDFRGAGGGDEAGGQGYSDSQWAEAFDEVRRGIDADAEGAPRRTTRGSDEPVTRDSRWLQPPSSSAAPAPPHISAPAAPPRATAAPPPPVPHPSSSATLSKADGNVGPSGIVQQMSRVFTVPEPDPVHVARLAAALQRADAAEAKEAPTVAAPAATVVPPVLAPVSGPATAQARASGTGADTAAVAVAAAVATLASQLQRETAYIESLQQPVHSSLFAATAPAIADAAGRIQRLAAALAALQPLLQQ